MKKIDVLKYFGSQIKTADSLGISQEAVSKWGDVIPEGRALKLARITNNELAYEEKYYEKPPVKNSSV